MSNGNGQTPPSPESRVAGPVGEVSKLLQSKAPAALETDALDPDDMTAPARGPVDPPPAPPPEPEPAPAAPPEPEQTAAELAAAQAEKVPKPDAHDVEVDVEGLSVGDVAGKLGVDARKLYEDLRIPLRDGRGSVSLSELKEGYNETAILDDKRETFSAERTTWQNEVMVARQEMATTVEMLSRVMTAELGAVAAPAKLAELYEHARAQTAAYRETESTALLARFPDWKDDKTRGAARDQMLEHLEPFGFSAIDLDNVLDHRLVAYVHANMERDRRITATRAKIERAPAPGQRAPAARTRQPSKARQSVERLTRAAQASGRREDQVPAIAALIAAGDARKR